MPRGPTVDRQPPVPDLRRADVGRDPVLASRTSFTNEARPACCRPLSAADRAARGGRWPHSNSTAALASRTVPVTVGSRRRSGEAWASLKRLSSSTWPQIRPAWLPCLCPSDATSPRDRSSTDGCHCAAAMTPVEVDRGIARVLEAMSLSAASNAPKAFQAGPCFGNVLLDHPQVKCSSETSARPPAAWDLPTAIKERRCCCWRPSPRRAARSGRIQGLNDRGALRCRPCVIQDSARRTTGTASC